MRTKHGYSNRDSSRQPADAGARTRRRSRFDLGRLFAFLGLLTGLCIFARPCAAQRFALPVDVGQGLVFGDGPRTPYLFGVSLEPGFDLGRWRFGALVSPSYRNPRWDLGLGARASLFVPLAAREVGVRFAAEGQYLPGERSGHLALGVIGEAFGLLRVGLWPGYDTKKQRAELMLTIGVDVIRWGRLLAGVRDHDRDRAAASRSCPVESCLSARNAPL